MPPPIQTTASPRVVGMQVTLDNEGKVLRAQTQLLESLLQSDFWRDLAQVEHLLHIRGPLGRPAWTRARVPQYPAGVRVDDVAECRTTIPDLRAGPAARTEGVLRVSKDHGFHVHPHKAETDAPDCIAHLAAPFLSDRSRQHGSCRSNYARNNSKLKYCPVRNYRATIEVCKRHLVRRAGPRSSCCAPEC